MKYKLQIVVLVLIVGLFGSVRVAAQTSIGLNVGVGTYKMADLRNVMASSVQELPISPELVTDFPAFIYYQPSFAVNGEHWNKGVSLSMFSSGSRWSIRDYSGEYRLDALVRGTAPSLFLERLLFRKNKFRSYLRFDAGGVFSSMQFHELFTVWDHEYINSTINLSSLNLFVAPQLNVKYDIKDKLTLCGFVGMQFDVVRSPLMNNPSFKDYLDNMFEDYTGTDWTGLRAGIGISYNF